MALFTRLGFHEETGAALAPAAAAAANNGDARNCLRVMGETPARHPGHKDYRGSSVKIASAIDNAIDNQGYGAMIRLADSNDVPALLAIQNDAPEAAQWSVDSLRSSLDHCLVAELDGVVAGFLVYLPVPPDEAEILNLAVDPGRRRRGVATRLVQALTAKVPGAIFLEVRASNAAARALYEGLDFVVTAVREGYYHRPVENALVMKRTSVFWKMQPMDY